jgi:hypothetical protein
MKHKLKRLLPTVCRKSFKAGKSGDVNHACKHCWAAGVLTSWRKRIKLLGAG